MHILIIGGSGRNGKLVIPAALARGHTVTALMRTPSSQPTPHANLTIIPGHPTTLADVQKALTTPTGPEAILITLSQRRVSDSPFAALSPDSTPTFMADALRTVLEAVGNARVRPKLVINSSQGVGESWASMTLPIRLVFRYSTMRVALQDHAQVDMLVRESGLDFVLARPPRLVDGPQAPLRVLADDGKNCGWNPTATRASLAAWMVDAAEASTWDGRAPVVLD